MRYAPDPLAEKPRPAAGTLATLRDGRVLLGRRRESLAFLGGFASFPGGRIEAADRELASVLFRRAEPDSLAIARAAALRELAEEAGLVLDQDRLVSIPRELDGLPKLDVYVALGAIPRESSLIPGGRWVTPEYAPRRFDTQFFLLTVGHADEPRAADQELEWVRFDHPARFLEAWTNFEILLAPPTRYGLRELARGLHGAPERLAAPEGAQGVPITEIESLSGIRQIPLRTPTLPPARHTNTFVIGHQTAIVVEPAPIDPDERDKLLDELAPERERGAKILAIVLTHHHGDHIGCAEWLSEKLGAPIWAHEKTKEILAGSVRVDRTLAEGDRIDLGVDATGRPFELEVLFTPGHAPGHVVLADLRPGSGAMVVGDMVAGIGTIVIDPSEGDMARYIRELERLRDRAPRFLFPAHGPPIVGGRRKLDEYIQHRLLREAKVLAALEKKGTASPEDLLEDAYDDTPRIMFPFAARSCLAHLLKLASEGRARQEGDRFAIVGR